MLKIGTIGVSEFNLLSNIEIMSLLADGKLNFELSYNLFS